MKHAAGLHGNSFCGYKVFHFNAGKGVTCAARPVAQNKFIPQLQGRDRAGGVDGGWLKTNEPFLGFREGAAD